MKLFFCSNLAHAVRSIARATYSNAKTTINAKISKIATSTAASGAKFVVMLRQFEWCAVGMYGRATVTLKTQRSRNASAFFFESKTADRLHAAMFASGKTANCARASGDQFFKNKQRLLIGRCSLYIFVVFKSCANASIFDDDEPHAAFRRSKAHATKLEKTFLHMANKKLYTQRLAYSTNSKRDEQKRRL